MSDDQPVLRLIRGNPDAEEVAAVTAVLTRLAVVANEPAEVPPPARSAWADPAALVRRPLPHGPGAWRNSALPR